VGGEKYKRIDLHINNRREAEKKPLHQKLRKKPMKGPRKG
jgi:hypothetical protein